mgnify:CR=1 FL=1
MSWWYWYVFLHVVIGLFSWAWFNYNLIQACTLEKVGLGLKVFGIFSAMIAGPFALFAGILTTLPFQSVKFGFKFW